MSTAKFSTTMLFIIGTNLRNKNDIVGLGIREAATNMASNSNIRKIFPQHSRIFKVKSVYKFIQIGY